MHIRMTTIDTEAARLDDVLAVARDEVGPIVDGLAGSCGMSAFVSRSTGRATVVTAWATEQDCVASDSALAPVRARTAAAVGGTIQAQEMEVALLERAVPASPGCWTRVTRTAGDPQRLEESIVGFAASVVPALRTLPGFCTVVLLVDRATGEAVSSTTWATREALDGSAQRSQLLRTSVAPALGREVIDVTEYEVAIAGIRPPQQHEELFRQAYAAMSAGGDLDALDALIVENVIEHAPVPPGFPSGRAGVKALMGAYREGLPDLQCTMTRYLEQGDVGCAVLKITGTHTGTLLGVPPSGRHVEMDAIDVVRIADGRAVEHWGAGDDLGMLTQIGAIPAMGDIPSQTVIQLPSYSDA